VPVIPATTESGLGRSQSETKVGKSRRRYLKNKPKQKRTGGVAPVVE
jgi:hypothetical protein